MTLISVAVAMVFAAAPSTASAVAAKPNNPPSTKVTIDGYDVDFTLPTASKAGCLVCHGDADLARVENGAVVSYYIDPSMVSTSAHAGVQCTGCHLDFAFSVPHESVKGGWRESAKMSCKNCHRDEFLEYGRSAHRVESGDVTSTVTGTPKPLCGDCHGSHDIAPLTDNPEARAALSRRGFEVCGQCHYDHAASYDDRYHGAAYWYGAADAPSCWDCHSAHEVLKASDKNSSVNERHLVETCAQCHASADESYVKYSKVIHRSPMPAEGSFVIRFVDRVREAFANIFGG